MESAEHQLKQPFATVKLINTKNPFDLASQQCCDLKRQQALIFHPCIRG